MIRLELQNLTAGYSLSPVVEDFTILIEDGEILSLLGPSGVGKTTILKTIAGLLKPLSGRILLDGKDVTNLPAEKRDTVLIFQKPLLFPFLNVGDNVGFGLKMAGIKRKNAEPEIDRMLELMGLIAFKNRKIHQLSGGQQQRVALARGLIINPSILLLDEPFSNLDTELRQQMRELICNVQQEINTTMLFVTHDQSEAFTISDRIALLLKGKIRQVGTPDTLFYKPCDADVARFFGNSNYLQIDGLDSLAVIRPEDIIISKKPAQDSQEGVIVHRQFEGTFTRFTVKTSDSQFVVRSLHSGFTIKEKVWLTFPKERLHILPQTLRL